MIKLTQFELAYIANTLKAYNVRHEAPTADILKFLARDADSLSARRSAELPFDLQRLEEVRHEAEATPANSAARSNALDRVTWHEKQIAKTRQRIKAFARLASKLAEADCLPIENW
jgi:hypothetical protein